MLLFTIATVIFTTTMLALLCWLLVGKGGHWLLKLLTITIVLCTSFTLYLLVNSYLGEPKFIDHKPDQTMIILTYLIQEPTKDDPDGAIYFWVNTPDHKIKPYYVYIKYSRKIHKQLELANANGLGQQFTLSYTEGNEVEGNSLGATIEPLVMDPLPDKINNPVPEPPG